MPGNNQENNQIVFDIVTNYNPSSLNVMMQQFTEARKEISGIDTAITQGMANLDAPAKLLHEQLDKCKVTAQTVLDKAKEAETVLNSDTATQEEKTTKAYDLKNAYDDFMAMQSLLTGKDFGGSFSVSMAKSMFSGLPAAVQSEINTITPQLVGSLRRLFNTMNGSAEIGKSIDMIAQSAMKDSSISSLLQSTGMTARQQDQVIKAFIPLVRPVQYSLEYQQARFGKEGMKNLPKIEHVEDILPALYKGSYANKGYSYDRIKDYEKQGTDALSEKGVDALASLISRNAVAARVAELSGIAIRNKEGKLTIPGNITRDKLGTYSESLWNEYQTRTTGVVDKIEDYFGANSKVSEAQRKNIERKIIDRSLSGTSSDSLLSMQALSDILLGDSFMPAGKGATGTRTLENEAKRIKEQYVVSKISPFISSADKDVALAESQVTRILGLQGKNNQRADAIKLISLAGYDESNPEHRKYIEDLKTNGYTDKNGHYVLHAMHGTGDSATARLIRDTEYYEAQRKYAPLARSLGLSGDDVWNTFIPRNHEFKSAEEMGKHLDQINKMWTDAFQAGSDLNGKKFAFVDFSKSGIKNSDGLGYVGSGIIPHDSQVRMGLSGKGSLVDIGFDTIGEWAENAGLRKNGKFMVTGINGEKFDASDYNGLIDISMMKNLLAYQGLNAEQANEALTGMMRAFPLGIVSDYSYDSDAKGLGSQMTSFIKLSPKLMSHQAVALVRRMQDLDTIEGMRRYVFNDPEHDPLSKLANDPVHGHEYMLGDERFQRRVDIYKDSLIRAASSGEFINLDDIADIKNERLTRNPLLAYALSEEGGLTDELLSDYGKILKDAHKRDFTNDEVRKLVMLEGGVADFEHIDANTIAAMRSPTGFGQVITRQNYAKLLKPLYEAKKLRTTGIQLNNEDMETLAGADMDADMAKVIADIKNEYGVSLVGEIQEYTKYIDKLKEGFEKTDVKRSALSPVKGGNIIDNPEVWLREAALLAKAPIEMGYMSGIGSRLSMLDTMSSQGKMIARISMKGNKGYDYATTNPKKPGDIDPDAEMMKALGLGYEFQKLPGSLEEMYNVKAVKEEGSDKLTYTTLDGKTDVRAEDVFQTSGGRLLNLGYLRGLDGTKLDRTNLPSIYSSSVMSGLLSGRALTSHGYNDRTIEQDLLEAFGVVDVNGQTGLSFGNVGPAVQRIMKNKRAMLAQFAGLTRSEVTPEEMQVLASQYAEAIQEIEEDANKNASKEYRGKVKKEDGSLVWRDEYIKERMKAAGLDQMSLSLGTYDKLGKELLNIGPSRENIEAVYGKEFADYMKSGGSVSLPDMTPGQFSPAYAQYSKYYVKGKNEPIFIDSTKREPVIETKEQAIDNRQEIEIDKKEDELAKIEEKINAEKARLQSEREARIKKHEEVRNKEYNLHDPYYSYKIPTKDELTRIIEEDQHQIEYAQRDIEELKKSDVFSSAMITDAEERKAAAEKHLDIAKKSLNEYYGELSSPELEELKRQKELIINQRKETAGANVAQTPFDYNQFRAMFSGGNHPTALIQDVLQAENAKEAARSMSEEMNELQRAFNKDIYYDPNRTQADSWYGINKRTLDRLHTQYDYLTKNGDQSIFGPNTPLGRQLAEQDAYLEKSYISARDSRFDRVTKNHQENLIRLAEGRGAADAQVERIEKMNNEIKEQQSELKHYEEDVTVKPGEKDVTGKIKSVKDAIDEMKQKRDVAIERMISDNESMFEDMGDEFEHVVSGTFKSADYKIAKKVKDTQKRLVDFSNKLDEYHDNKLISDDAYNRLKDAQKKQLEKVYDGTYQRTLEREYEQKETNAREKRIRQSRQNALSLVSEATGEPISATEYASMQAANLNSQIKNRRNELKNLLKDNSLNADERKAYEDELTKLNGIDLRGTYSQYLGTAKANENLRNINNAKAMTSLERLFSGSTGLSLNEMISDAVQNANIQIENTIKTLGLNNKQAKALRSRFSDTSAIERNVLEQWEAQQEAENIQNIQRRAHLTEMLTGRKMTPQEKANFAVASATKDINDYRRSLQKKLRRNGLTQQERQDLQDELDQWDLGKIDLTGYRSRVESAAMIENEIKSRALEMERIQTEAKLSGRAATRQERVGLFASQLKQSRDNLRSRYIQEGNTTEADRINSTYTDDYLDRLAERQTIEQERVQKIQLKNQEEANRIQNENMLYSINRQQQQRQRQQLRGFATTRVEQAVFNWQDRVYAAQDSLRSYEQREKQLLGQRNLIEEQLKQSGLSEDKRSQLESERTKITDSITANAKAIGLARDELNDLNSVGGVTSAVFTSVAQSLEMVAKRFGRQLFQKAIQETKRFVKEYDASMATIQMITLKSNDEMKTIGNGLIDKAKELKISVSEISQSATDLYRQGLSDDEVNERLGIISKFSKVSGTKIDAATKLITIAMNTGLVTNPQTAADVVTALGDNAATNAAEIEKGIEKAGAAAAADGTTFGQLAAMLTAITSTTQIGGNVAGRTLNTLFSRVNKIGKNELIYDENGYAVSGSAVAKQLKEVGVDTYINGKKRSSFDVLYSLSKKWDALSDAQQQQLANSIAGTRMYSNFSAIMQGMAEGDIDKYLSLLDESAGITDKKYEIYTETLAASLTNLQNVFDGLVHDVVDSGFAGDVIDWFASVIQGIDNIVKSSNGLGGVLAALIPIASVLVGIKALEYGGTSGIPIAIGAFTVAGVSAIGLNVIGNQQNKEKANIEKYETGKEFYEKKINSKYSNIDALQQYRNASSQDRTKEETNEYIEAMKKVARDAGIREVEVGDSTIAIDKLKESIETLGISADEVADRILAAATKMREDDWANNVYYSKANAASVVAQSFAKEEKELLTKPDISSPIYEGIFKYDEKEDRFKVANEEDSVSMFFQRARDYENEGKASKALVKAAALSSYDFADKYLGKPSNEINDDDINDLFKNWDRNENINGILTDLLKLNPETSKDSFARKEYELAYSAFLPKISSLMMGSEYYNDEDIATLTELASEHFIENFYKYDSQNHIIDEAASMAANDAINYITANENSAKSTKQNISLLLGNRKSKKETGNEFTSGEYDYYVDEKGNVFTKEQYFAAKKEISGLVAARNKEIQTNNNKLIKDKALQLYEEEQSRQDEYNKEEYENKVISEYRNRAANELGWSSDYNYYIETEKNKKNAERTKINNALTFWDNSSIANKSKYFNGDELPSDITARTINAMTLDDYVKAVAKLSYSQYGQDEFVNALMPDLIKQEYQNAYITKKREEAQHEAWRTLDDKTKNALLQEEGKKLAQPVLYQENVMSYDEFKDRNETLIKTAEELAKESTESVRDQNIGLYGERAFEIFADELRKDSDFQEKYNAQTVGEDYVNYMIQELWNNKKYENIDGEEFGKRYYLEQAAKELGVQFYEDIPPDIPSSAIEINEEVLKSSYLEYVDGVNKANEEAVQTYNEEIANWVQQATENAESNYAKTFILPADQFSEAQKEWESLTNEERLAFAKQQSNWDKINNSAEKQLQKKWEGLSDEDKLAYILTALKDKGIEIEQGYDSYVAEIETKNKEAEEQARKSTTERRKEFIENNDEIGKQRFLDKKLSGLQYYSYDNGRVVLQKNIMSKREYEKKIKQKAIELIGGNEALENEARKKYEKDIMEMYGLTEEEVNAYLQGSGNTFEKLVKEKRNSYYADVWNSLAPEQKSNYLQRAAEMVTLNPEVESIDYTTLKDDELSKIPYGKVEGRTYSNLEKFLRNGNWQTKAKADEAAELQEAVNRSIERFREVKTLEAFEEFLADNADFVSVVENSTKLKNIMRQIPIDTITGEVSAVSPEIFGEINDALIEMSNTYSVYKDVAETAEIARDALDSVLSGKAFRTEAEKRVKIEKVEEEKEKDRLENIPSLNDNQRAAIQKTINNEELYSKFINGEEFRAEELDLVNKLVGEAVYGGTSLGQKDTLEGIKKVYQTIENEEKIGKDEGYSKAVADYYMTGFSDWGELSSLYAKKQEGELTNEEMSDFNSLMMKFKKFKENAEIEFEVRGIRNLEEAGNIIEGTTDKIVALKKGGEDAAQALLQLSINAYTKGQQRARLFSDNERERNTAAMELSGLRAEEYYANIGEVLPWIKLLQEFEIGKSAASYALMWQKSSGDQRSQIEKIAETEGFRFKAPLTSEQRNMLASQSAYAVDVENNRNMFGWVGAERKYVNPFTGAEKTYSDLELAIARSRILSGDLIQELDNELYTAAAGTFANGSYGRRVLELRGNGQEPSQELVNLAYREQNKAVYDVAQGYRDEALNIYKGELAIKDANKEENTEFLSKLFNKNDTEIKEMSAEDLENALNEKRNELMDKVKEELSNIDLNASEAGIQNIDLGSVTGFSDLITTLQIAKEGADEAAAKAIDEYISAFTSAKNAVENSMSDAYDSAIKKMEESLYERKGVNFISDNLASAMKIKEQMPDKSIVSILQNMEGWNPSWASATFNNTNNAAVLKLLDENGDKSRPFADKYFEYQITGRTHDSEYYANIGRELFGSDRISPQGQIIFKNTEEDLKKLREEFDAVKNDVKKAGLFEELTSGYSEFNEVNDSLTKGLDSASGAIVKFNSNVKTSGSNLDKYGEKADQIRSILKNINGPKDQAAKQLSDMQNDIANISERGAWRSLWNLGDRKDDVKNKIASMIGVSTDQLDVMSEAEVKIAIGNVEIVDEDKIETYILAAIEGMNTDIQNMLNSVQTEFETAGIDLTGGPIYMDLSEFYAKFGEILDDSTKQLLEMLKNSGVDAKIKVESDGEGNIKVSYDAESYSPRVRSYTPTRSYGGRSYGGSGSSSGNDTSNERSEASKLLQSQRDYIASIQHENNLLNIEAEEAARRNDIPRYQKLIDDQIEGQTTLRDAYERNISELQNMLGTLDSTEDEWYQIQEAIRSAEEEVAKYNANIAELESKKLQENKEEYEYNKSIVTHDYNMLDIDNQKNKRLNNYSGWRESIAQRASNYMSQIAIDRNYASVLQNRINEQIAAGNGNTDYTRELVKEFNDLIESSEKLNEQIHDLDNEIVELNNTMKSNALQTPQHWEKIYSSEGEMAKRNKDWGYSIAVNNEQRENNREQIRLLQEDIARVKEDLNNATVSFVATEGYDGTEWLEDMQQFNREIESGLWSEEDIERIKKDMLEMRRALNFDEETEGSAQWYSLLQQIYDDEESILQLQLADMDLQLQRLNDIKSAYDEILEDYKQIETMEFNNFEIKGFENDYSGMFTSLNNYMLALKERDKALEDYLDVLGWEAFDAESDEVRSEIESTINQVTEERQQIQKDLNSIWEKRLSTLNEKQERERSPIQHRQTMLGYDEQYYTRLNDYGKLIEIINRADEARRDDIATLQDQKKELELEQSIVESNSDAWWELQNRIQEVDKQIKEDTKAIDENNKKRLQALQIKQQNEDKNENMYLDLKAVEIERTQLLENDEAWETAINAKAQALQSSIEQNKTQIKEAEDLLSTFVIESDEWLRTRDMIWALKKETAQKENESLKIEQQIDAQRLANIQKEAARTSAYDNTSIRQLEVYGNIYQKFGRYDSYRESLHRESDAYENIIKYSEDARDAIVRQMETLEKGTTAWYNARDAVYAYDEAIASARNSIVDRQLAIEEANIKELTTNYNDSQIKSNVSLQTIRSRRQMYDDANDFENYQKLGLKEKKILDEQIESKKEYVENLKNLLKETAKGSSNWYNLRNTIAQTIADIANMETQSDKLGRQQEQSKIDHMLEKMNYEDSNRKHNLTLIQYEQTKYQNAGELSNYGIMLEKENDLLLETIEANKRDIEVLKEEQDTLVKGSKEYNRLTEEIKKKEEAIASDTVSVEKNTKAIKENADAIQKTRKAIEDTVEKEIKTREEQRKKRLSAEVSLQKTLLDTIKQYYQDQWNLEKQDLEKKQDALKKEKELINERLNARKKAVDTEEKYRELEELQRQLALISNDPTRTKDVKELQSKISDIEKDLSWEKAFEEAESATKQIDDQIQAISDYTLVHGENLEEMLANANNFSEQIATIMEGGWESVSAYLIEYNKEFNNSLAEAQQQMLEGWEQTWKDMNGIIDTYWNQISEVLSSYENFVNFMKDSTEYINSSEAGKNILEFGWEVLYDNWVKSGMIAPEAQNYTTDEHPWYDVEGTSTAEDVFSQDFAWLRWSGAEPYGPSDESLMDVVAYDDVGIDEKQRDIGRIDYDFYERFGKLMDSISAYTGGESNNTPISTNNNTLKIEFVRPDILNEKYEPYHEDYTKYGIIDDDIKSGVNKDNYYSIGTISVTPSSTSSTSSSNSSTSSSSSTSSNSSTKTNRLPYNKFSRHYDEYSSNSNSYDNTYYSPFTKEEDDAFWDAWDQNSTSSKTSSSESSTTSNNNNITLTAEPLTPTYTTLTAEPLNSTASTTNNATDKAATAVATAANAVASAAKETTAVTAVATVATALTAAASAVKNLLGFDEGGLVDFTGPAWVDGTKARPEAFLDAEDTQLIRKMVDSLNYVSLKSGIWPDSGMFSSGSTTYGNISITINQAELKDDADYEDVARRVGKAITKEMSKKGYNLTGYNL